MHDPTLPADPTGPTILDYATHLLTLDNTLLPTKLHALTYRIQGLHATIKGWYAFDDDFVTCAPPDRNPNRGAVVAPAIRNALITHKQPSGTPDIYEIGNPHPHPLNPQQQIIANAVYNHLSGLTGIQQHYIITSHPESAYARTARMLGDKARIPKPLVVEPYLAGDGFRTSQGRHA